MWRASRIVSLVFGGLFLAAIGGIFYQPLPPHLEDWWRVQFFFAKFKINMIKSELQYRFGSKPRLHYIRQAIGASLTVPLTQMDKDALKIYDREINGVPVRIYRPKSATDLLPGLVYLHGGAWIMFSVEVFDGVCAHIAREANIVVVSVEYRLAPEHPFPAGFEDCLSVTKYVLKKGRELSVDSNRVAVGGDSAGGNLAAAVALKLRDEKVSPGLKAQLIIYGNVQFSHVTLPCHVVRENYGGKQIQIFSFFLGSYLNLNDAQISLINSEKYLTPQIKAKSDKYVDVSLLPKEFISEGYVPGNHEATTMTDDVIRMNTHLDDTRLAPLMCEDLSNLPSSLVVSVDWDTLRDDGVMYAERMKRAGNDVKLLYLNGTWHGILQKFDYNRYGFKAGTVIMNAILDFIKNKLVY